MFLVGFGAGMQATQLSDPGLVAFCWDLLPRASTANGSSPSRYIEIVENDPRDRPDGGDCYRFSRNCCTSTPFNTSYNIVHTVGGVIAIAHIMYFVSRLLFYASFTFVKFLFVFDTQLKTVIWTVPFVVMMFVYEHLVYRVFFCGHKDRAFCILESDDEKTLHKAFLSILTFAVVFSVTQLGYAVIFVLLFLNKRTVTWNKILDIEDTLFFHEVFRNEFEAKKLLVPTYKIDVRMFVSYWTNKKDEEILENIPRKAKKLFDVFRNELSIEDKSFVTKADFMVFCLKNSIADAPKLWETLTQGENRPWISEDSLYDLVYDLFLSRKKLALAVMSDMKIVGSIWMYASVTLYPGCFIIVSKIFDYADAFSQGVDLFKTYSVIVSFIYSRIVTNVQFMLMMLWERPFDIGDLLLVDGQIFYVKDFTASHTELLGPYNMLLTNDHLVKDRVSNLTKCNFIDYFDVEIPHVAELDQYKICQTLTDSYVNEFPRDVVKHSVYCTWVRGDGGGKDALVVRSHWKYKFPLLDRSRLLHTQARIRTYLVDRMREELRRTTILINAASGGAYNEHPVIRKYGDKLD